jgi:hypothetical protein
MNAVSFDHPDPSIFTVLTVPSATPGGGTNCVCWSCVLCDTSWCRTLVVSLRATKGASCFLGRVPGAAGGRVRHSLPPQCPHSCLCSHICGLLVSVFFPVLSLCCQVLLLLTLSSSRPAGLWLSTPSSHHTTTGALQQICTVFPVQYRLFSGTLLACARLPTGGQHVNTFVCLLASTLHAPLLCFWELQYSANKRVLQGSLCLCCCVPLQECHE